MDKKLFICTMQPVIANNAKITVDTKCYATYALADLAFLIDYYNARSGARIPRMDCASMIGFASAQPILRRRKDLSRVHNVVRVERLLDRLHGCDRAAVLGFKILDLAVTHAVLAGAGAVHGDRAQRQPCDEALGPHELV